MNAQQQPQLYHQMQNMNISQGLVSNYQTGLPTTTNQHSVHQSGMVNSQGSTYPNNQAFGNWNNASGHTLSTQLWK